MLGRFFRVLEELRVDDDGEADRYNRHEDASGGDGQTHSSHSGGTQGKGAQSAALTNLSYGELKWRFGRKYKENWKILQEKPPFVGAWIEKSAKWEDFSC
jgi:hypothetical protein